MPDPQPSAAAMRLAEIACDVLWPDRTLRGLGANTDCAIAIALDDAGVGKAVEKLKYAINFKSPTSDKITLYVQLSGCHKVFVEVLAALTGDDDA